jgi:hypothetical protein
VTIDFAKSWKASIEFVEQFQGDDLQGLIEEGAFEMGASPTPAAIVAAWPSGFVPRALQLVDEKGKIPPARRNLNPKKRADTRSADER